MRGSWCPEGGCPEEVAASSRRPGAGPGRRRRWCHHKTALVLRRSHLRGHRACRAHSRCYRGRTGHSGTGRITSRGLPRARYSAGRKIRTPRHGCKISRSWSLDTIVSAWAARANSKYLLSAASRQSITAIAGSKHEAPETIWSSLGPDGSNAVLAVAGPGTPGPETVNRTRGFRRRIPAPRHVTAQPGPRRAMSSYATLEPHAVPPWASAAWWPPVARSGAGTVPHIPPRRRTN
jgi:hypothetical protein